MEEAYALPSPEKSQRNCPGSIPLHQEERETLLPQPPGRISLKGGSEFDFRRIMSMWARRITVRSKHYALRGQQKKVIIESTFQKRTAKVFLFVRNLPPVKAAKKFNKRNKKCCMMGFALVQLLCGILLGVEGILTLNHQIRSMCDHQNFEGLWCTITASLCIIGAIFGMVCIHVPENTVVISLYTMPTLVGFLSLLYWLFDLAVCIKRNSEKQTKVCNEKTAIIMEILNSNSSDPMNATYTTKLIGFAEVPDCFQLRQRTFLFPFVCIVGNMYVIAMFALCNQWNVDKE